MADEPTDFEAQRWDRVQAPCEHQPVVALRRALAAIESGNIDPKHVIVLWTEGERSGYFQAGDLCGFGQVGFIEVCSDMMKESSR